MKLDNYELSTVHYTLSYYIDNANLDEDEVEWLNLLKEKVDSMMLSQLNCVGTSNQATQISGTLIMDMSKLSIIISIYITEVL